MYIEKLPSGSYRITQTENGRRYRVTIDHRPTQTEAVRLLSDVISKPPVRANMTFSDACIAFMDSKSNVLSPSTIREYRNTIRQLPDSFSRKFINTITTLDVQTLVNDWSATRSPKTVKNYSNFVMSVLKSSDIDIKSPFLPKNHKKEPYIPSESDIKSIQKVLEGTAYEIPFYLMCLGLRRSELCALTIDDLHGNILTVNKALVLDSEKKWVIKRTKTAKSDRNIPISDKIADKIREQGYIYRGHPANLYDNLRKAQDKAGVPHFKLHALRHFFCSYMHDKGYSDKQIQEMGGWSDGSQVMREVYKHALNMETAKKQMSNDILSLFD